MTARVRIALFSFCFALALATYAGRASAVDSDRMVITDLSTGTAIFDQTIPEPGPGGPPPRLRSSSALRCRFRYRRSAESSRSP